MKTTAVRLMPLVLLAACGSPASEQRLVMETSAPAPVEPEPSLKPLLQPRVQPTRAARSQVRKQMRTQETRRSTRRYRVSVDGLNWHALALCESGNNPRAVSRTGKYRGLYQFSLATWRSVGGVGDPIDASREEQTYRAQLLYKRSGAGQWPVCGRRL